MNVKKKMMMETFKKILNSNNFPKALSFLQNQPQFREYDQQSFLDFHGNFEPQRDKGLSFTGNYEKRYYRGLYYFKPKNNNNNDNNNNKKQSDFNFIELLIISNVCVFFFMRLFPEKKRRWLIDELGCSVKNFKNFKFYTLLTSFFVHQDLRHLLFNSIGIYYLGNNLLGVIGKRSMSRLFMVSTIAASGLNLAEKYYRFKYSSRMDEKISMYYAPTIGSSGFASALITVNALLLPRAPIYLYFVFPIQLRHLFFGLVAYDLYKMIEGRSRVANSAHLGGGLAGLVLFRKFIPRLFM